jgi:hypothetical protein
MTIISKDLEKLVETGSKEAEKLHKKFKELITT